MVNRPGMTPAAEAHLRDRDYFHPAIAVFVDWPGDASYSHTGVGDLVFGGMTFSGVANMGSVQVPAETSELSPTAAELELVGVPDHLLMMVANQDSRGRLVRLWVGLVTEPAGNTLVTGTGLIDWYQGHIVKQTLRMRLVENEDGTSVEQSLILTVNSGPRGRSSASATHSYEDQKSKYPNDTAGRHTVYAEKNARREFWAP